MKAKTLSLVKKAKILTEARISEKSAFENLRHERDVEFFIQGNTEINNREVSILIGFNKHFPRHIPKYFLYPYNILGLIPHVDHRGNICYISNEGLLTNYSDELGVLLCSFTRMKNVLEDGIIKRNHRDFLKEFESYWISNRKITKNTYYSLINSGDEVKKFECVEIWRKGKSSNPDFVIADDIIDIDNYYPKIYSEKKTCSKGIFIPLKKNPLITPPQYDKFWTISDLHDAIFNNISEPNRETLAKLLRRSKKVGKTIVLSVPDGEKKSLIGIKLLVKEANNKIHPLLNQSIHTDLIPFSVTRSDKKYLISRGGGTQKLLTKKVLLIGCGSLGGYIAVEIAKSGIQSLSLVDDDIVMLENIHRHSLGIDKLYQNKANALKNEIEKKLPFASIECPGQGKKIEEIIEQNILEFKEYDLVIISTGNPTINLYLNEILIRSSNTPPALYTMLEPYGIGGHAFLTGNNEKNGCLHCLYTENCTEGTIFRENRWSFAAPDQHFAKSLSGCANVFTPFSSLDSIQTALLATRLAIQCLTGQEKDNPFLSWKGDPTLFLEEGFKTTERFKKSTEKLFNERYMYKVNDCMVCGSESGQKR